jgi:hypothetical protein
MLWEEAERWRPVQVPAQAVEAVLIRMQVQAMVEEQPLVLVLAAVVVVAALLVAQVQTKVAAVEHWQAVDLLASRHQTILSQCD